MFKKKGKIVTLGIITSFVLGAFLFSGVTFAAFLNQLRINNEIKVDTSKAEGKFASGNGTKESPYLINSAEQLRNLQKLNMLDLFDSKTYFVLPENGTIDCTGVRLKPIGTEDHPFDSQFNGRGCKIKNLTIDGRDTEDIGMFGYTGINSRVMNFFLIHPIINVLYNSDGKGFEPSTNVLAKDESVTGVAKTLTLTGSNATANKSVITIPSSNKTEINLSSGRGTLPIKYASTNPQVYDPNVSGDYIKYPEGVEIYSGLYTFQIYAYIEYYDFEHVIDTPELVQYKYVLERWNIELLCKKEGDVKSVSINARDDGTLNIYPTKHRLEQDVRQDHGLNVGFFIGHCDGGASHLGLYGGSALDSANSANPLNGIINLNGRAAKSTGSLIGRDRLDNPLDNTAKNRFNKLFDFTQSRLTSGYKANTPSLIDNIFKNNTAPVLAGPTTALNKKARDMFVLQNERSINLTDTLLDELNISDATKRTSYYARFYPKIVDKDKTSISKYIAKSEYSGTNALRIDSPSRVGTYISTKILDRMISFAASSEDSNFYLENALWFWATRKLKDSMFQAILGNIFGEKSVFNANLKLKYIVKPKDVNKLTNIKFKVMTNDYLIGRQAEYHNNANDKFDVPDFKNLIWQDLLKANIVEKDQNAWNLINSTEQYNQIVDKEINFKVEVPVSSKMDGTSPMFYIGVGLPNESYKITNSPSGENTQAHEFIGIPGWVGSFNNSTYYSGYNPKANGKDDWVDDDKKYYVDNKRIYYMIQEKWDSNIEYIDLLNADLSFNTTNGNTSSLTNNVDFLSIDPTKTNFGYNSKNPVGKPFSNWESSSNTKIAFNLNVNDSTAVNNYYRAESGFIVKSTTVYLYYTSSNGTYVPTNTKGFAEASINKQ